MGEIKAETISMTSALHIIVTDNLNKKFERILLFAFIATLTLAITVPSLSIVGKYVFVPILLIILFKYDSFVFLIFPLTFLENSLGVYLMGKVTIMWFYLFLFVSKLLLQRYEPTLKKDLIVPVIIVTLYFVIAILEYGTQSIKSILVVILFYKISSEFKNDTNKLKDFNYVILLSSLMAAFCLVFGIKDLSFVETRFENLGVIRATGIGFGDPNYTSFIVLLGLCVLINMSSHKRFFDIGIILLMTMFIIAIFRSGSRAGLISVVIILIMKIATLKGFKNKIQALIGLSMLIALIVVLVKYVFIPTNLEFLLTRWDETFYSLSMKDYNFTTANRSVIFSDYIGYLGSQDINKMLFGGNIVGSDSIKQIAGGAVTHCTYIDYVLAFGMIGGLIITYYQIRRTRLYYYLYKRTGESEYFTTLMMKVIALTFGISLAMLQVNLWWIIFFL